MNKELINNINKIHTTKLGVSRIKNNLKIEGIDAVSYCKDIVLNKDSIITKKERIITVN